MNNRRQVIDNDKRYQLKHAASLIDRQYGIPLTKSRRSYHCEQYVDLLRRCHRINRKQFEIGMALAPEWHGTSSELLQAIKDFSHE